ncbi:hypothetical protein [Synechocystis sp. LKSZ1]|uniref:hypothetical protein n=1 Tax=Synechocystis sp. LKSZ1 TaxID=3144951 RepID=UPI00336BC9E9
MFFWGIKTYIKESIKLKNDYPDYFNFWDLVKLFPKWRTNLNGKSNPLKDEQPWITFLAIDFLEKNLNKDMRVYEYGMGGSTLFFAKRVKEIISVEHDKKWFNLVEENIKKKGYSNWKGYLIEAETSVKNVDINASDPDSYTSEDENFKERTFKNYAMSIDNYPDQYFDLVLIDGRARPSCFKHAYKKVKSGGIIMLDNSDRDYYLIYINKIVPKNIVSVDFPGFCPYLSSLSKTSAWIFDA